MRHRPDVCRRTDQHGAPVGLANRNTLENLKPGATNFAQRSDQRHEMLNHTAQFNQTERSAQWRKEIAIFPSLPLVAKQTVLSRLPVAGIVVDLEKSETIGIQVISYEPVDEYSVQVLTPGPTL